MEINIYYLILLAAFIGATIMIINFVFVKDYAMKHDNNSLVLVTTIAVIVVFGAIFVFFCKPDVNSKEYEYNILNNYNNGYITYVDTNDKVVTKAVVQMPKTYDDNSKTNYVAKLKIRFGPIYSFRDYYVYGKSDDRSDDI